jgi:hypothetical protein
MQRCCLLSKQNPLLYEVEKNQKQKIDSLIAFNDKTNYNTWRCCRPLTIIFFCTFNVEPSLSESSDTHTKKKLYAPCLQNFAGHSQAPP